MDLVTLQNELREKDVPPEVSEPGICAGSGDGSTDLGQCEVLCAISCKDNSMRRKLIKLNEEIENLCYVGKEPAGDMSCDMTEKKVFDLRSSRGGGGDYVPIRQVVYECPREDRERVKDIRERLPVYRPDLLIWITSTAGLQPSDLILIAARPSMGKTAFVLKHCTVCGISRKDVYLPSFQPGDVQGAAGQPSAVYGVQTWMPRRSVTGNLVGCRLGEADRGSRNASVIPS